MYKAIKEYLLAQNALCESGDIEDSIRYNEALTALEDAMGFPDDLVHIFNGENDGK
jgi:hypothetical protein